VRLLQTKMTENARAFYSTEVSFTPDRGLGLSVKRPCYGINTNRCRLATPLMPSLGSRQIARKFRFLAAGSIRLGEVPPALARQAGSGAASKGKDRTFGAGPIVALIDSAA
jgi:hypothetical protein